MVYYISANVGKAGSVLIAKGRGEEVEKNGSE
jgi:hypothetical protein